MTNEEYMNLILKKDEIEKDGEQYYIEYVSIFGSLLIKQYELNIEIIKYRKMISYCIKKANYGEKIDNIELNKYIDNEMKTYYLELDKMQEEYDNINVGYSKISIYDARKIKKLYYEIAKKCHPDSANKDRIDLFMKAKTAYQNNDLKTLEELMDIVSILDDEDFIVIDLEKKIGKLNQEIDELLNNKPYILKYDFTPTKREEEKKKELTKDIENSNKIIEELKKKLEEFSINEIIS